MTSLMFGRRVSKCDPRVEAYGTVDELNAALGLARAQAAGTESGERLLRIQRDLVTLMGELATHPEDLARYGESGFPRVTRAMTEVLDGWVREIEAVGVTMRGWAMPGENTLSAGLDLARTVCRRAERRVCAVQERGELGNDEVVIYLNRLADLLWLLARMAEAGQGPVGTGSG
jgi:cob(I)alamin adenosyltransferase